MKSCVLLKFVFIISMCLLSIACQESLMVHYISQSKSTLLKNNKAPVNKNFRKSRNLNSTDLNSGQEEEIPEPKIYSGNCFIKMHNWLYDLNPISPKNTDFTIKSKEGKIIKFNLCNDVESTCPEKGLIMEEENCKLFSSQWSNDKIWELTMDTTSKQEKITLTLPQGKNCSSSQNDVVTVEILCNPNAKENKILNEREFSSAKCKNVIKIESKHSCKTSKFTVWYKQFGVNKYMIGSILSAVGIFFVLFGNTYFEISSSIIVGLASGIIIKSFLNLDILICFLIGLILAALLFKFVNLIGIALSIVLGFIFGNIAYNYFIKLFPFVDPNLLYAIAIIACIILVFCLKYFTLSILIIISASIVGSYMCMRGLSICLGGFPDESYTSILIMYKELNQLSKVFGGTANIYLISILILFAFGMFYQGASLCCGEEKDQTENDADKGDGEKNGDNEGKDENEKLNKKEYEKKENNA